MGYLENITFRGKVVFSVMMLVLVIIGLYFLAYKPRIARMIQTRTRLETLVAEIDSEMRAEERAQRLTRGDDKKWAEIEPALQRRLPEEMRLPGALESIAGLARETGIKDLTMVSMPSGANENGGQSQVIRVGDREFNIQEDEEVRAAVNPIEGSELDQVTINLAFHCEYSSVAEFLESLTRLPRLVVIEKVDIEREIPLISVNMSVRIFSLVQKAGPFRVASISGE